jgi:ABC-2 type transport system ATP-binding protein
MEGLGGARAEDAIQNAGKAVQNAVPNAIVVRDLVKRYGDRTAVDGISFEVAPGELFALLGPNGAGKTTTVEILEGFRRPDGGIVRVLGLDPGREGEELRGSIGVMLQEPGLYPLLKPPEIVRLFAAYYPAAGTEPAEALLGRVGLEDAAVLRTPFRRLSRGERQRVSLAVALVGRPRLVFLDEPTAGLDPAARIRTEAIVAELRAAGVTILLTTHDLAQAERLADRVAIIDAGRSVALGTTGELLGGVDMLRFVALPGLPVAELSAELDATVTEESAGAYVVDGEVSPELVAALAAALARRDVLARQIRVGPGSLEALFLRLTSESEQ